MASEAEAGSPWVGEELQRVGAGLAALDRQLEHLRAAQAGHQELLDELQQGLATVEGRTRRHETGQDQTRELRQQIGALEERLEAEVGLRRELAARLDRATGHENDALQQLTRGLEHVALRLEQVERRQEAADERHRDAVEELAGRDLGDRDLTERLDGLEHRVAADREGDRHRGEDLARISAVVPGLVAAMDELRERVQSLSVDQRRIDDELASRREGYEREVALLDLVEQQRALRARLEERLAQAEEALDELRRADVGEAEERARVARTQSGLGEQIRSLGEAIEAQRLVLIEHLRRQLRADGESARLRVELIEREQHVARDLLVRLSEESLETRPGEEPPL